MSGKERELRQSKQNWQKSAKESNELSRQVNKLKNELSATVSELNEKDGLALALEEKFQISTYSNFLQIISYNNFIQQPQSSHF